MLCNFFHVVAVETNIDWKITYQFNQSPTYCAKQKRGTENQHTYTLQIKSKLWQQSPTQKVNSN